jgi:hypothetical protein
LECIVWCVRTRTCIDNMDFDLVVAIAECEMMCNAFLEKRLKERERDGERIENLIPLKLLAKDNRTRQRK